MPRDGSGNYIPPSSSWSPAQNGSAATPDDWNQLLTDIATALTQSMSRDGQAPMTGELQMGNNKLTDVAKGTNPTDAATLQNIYDRTGQAGAVGFRNKVMNGNFSINQRNWTSPVTLGAYAYGHDRWKAGAAGVTYSFAASTPPDTTLTISAGTIQQVIPGADLGETTYTLSWGGSAQGKINAGGYAASPITATVTPGLDMLIEFSTGTLTNVQVEAGSTATPFERRPVSLEMTLCQYYFKLVQAVVFKANNSGNFGGSLTNVMFSRMRITPTVGTTDRVGGTANATAFEPASPTSMRVYYTGNPDVGTWTEYQIQLVADY